jgi:hypothetical protein
MGGEEGQTPVLFLDLCRVSVGAGEAHRHVFTQPESRVVPAVELNGGDRKIGPLGELARQQTRHQLRGDRSLVHESIVPMPLIGCGCFTCSG